MGGGGFGVPWGEQAPPGLGRPSAWGGGWGVTVSPGAGDTFQAAGPGGRRPEFVT